MTTGKIWLMFVTVTLGLIIGYLRVLVSTVCNDTAGICHTESRAGYAEQSGE